MFFTWWDVFVPQEAMQQWYQHYQAAAQAHSYNTAAPQDSTTADYSKEHTQVTHTHTHTHTLTRLSLSDQW